MEAADTVPASSGVTQGSIFYPILFLVYVNDLPNVVSPEMCMFADDICIFGHTRNNTDCGKVQQDLCKPL